MTNPPPWKYTTSPVGSPSPRDRSGSGCHPEHSSLTWAISGVERHSRTGLELVPKDLRDRGLRMASPSIGFSANHLDTHGSSTTLYSTDITPSIENCVVRSFSSIGTNFRLVTTSLRRRAPRSRAAAKTPAGRASFDHHRAERCSRTALALAHVWAQHASHVTRVLDNLDVL